MRVDIKIFVRFVKIKMSADLINIFQAKKNKAN
jgi:hypothetical protein